MGRVMIWTLCERDPRSCGGEVMGSSGWGWAGTAPPLVFPFVSMNSGEMKRRDLEEERGEMPGTGPHLETPQDGGRSSYFSLAGSVRGFVCGWLSVLER